MLCHFISVNDCLCANYSLDMGKLSFSFPFCRVFMDSLITSGCMPSRHQTKALINLGPHWLITKPDDLTVVGSDLATRNAFFCGINYPHLGGAPA